MRPITDIDSGLTDFSALTRLKVEAGQANASPEVKRKVAEQLETVFLQMMLTSMREASGEAEGLFDSSETQFYREIFDQKIAASLAGKHSFGLADMIYNQLTNQPAAKGKEASLNAMLPPRAFVGRPVPLASVDPLPPASPKLKTQDIASKPLESAWDTPARFVQALYPQALEATRDTNIKPEAVLSVAALETGWGQHMIRDNQGNSSFNLFGIKATVDWVGKRIASPTLEYEAGVITKKIQTFRAYDKPADAFKDFVAFLKNNPRYKDALEVAHNPEEFIRELKKAGYATDPEYDKKIISVLNSISMQEHIQSALQENKPRPML